MKTTQRPVAAPTIATPAASGAAAGAERRSGPRRDGLLPIPAIQGNGEASPLVGQSVTTSGVVTGTTLFIDRDGTERQSIFVQDPVGDGDVRTSDALLVRPSEKLAVRTGDVVNVNGVVDETTGMTAINGEANVIAQAKKGARMVAAPQPVGLQLPADSVEASRYLESREGMLTRLDNAIVTTPTTSYGLFTVADAAARGVAKDYDRANLGHHIAVTGDMGGRLNVGTGDRVSRVEGPLEFNRGEFRVVQMPGVAAVTPGAPAPRMWGDLDGDDSIGAADLKAIAGREGTAASGPLDGADLDGNGRITADDTRIARDRAARVTGSPAFTVASMNAENFFDTVDDPKRKDTIVSPEEYRSKIDSVSKAIVGELGAPTVVGLQEVENETVLRDLVAQQEMRKAGYDFAIMQGPDYRGINVALLYRKSAGVEVSNVRQEQGQTTLDDKYGSLPPGSEQNLFARPPLVADVKVTDPASGAKQDLTVMVNHFMSKYSPSGRPTEPWRVEQAQFVRDLARKLRTERPDVPVIAMGDLNDHDSSTPIKLLNDKVHSALTSVGQAAIPRGERYTYQYRGSTESIDHMFVTPDLAGQIERAGVRHAHADRPSGSADGQFADTRPTDHDLLYAAFRFGQPPATQPAKGGQGKGRAAAR